MKGKIIVIILVSVIIYLLLSATLVLAMPFLVTWGEEKAWYLQTISFLQDFPFNLLRADGKIKMGLIFINALFWTLCIAALLYAVPKLIENRKNRRL